MSIYKSEVTTIAGRYILYVESNEHNARTDMHTVALAEFGRNYRMHEATKTTRNALKNAEPVKRCVSHQTGEPIHWAWLKKARKQAK